MSADVDLLATIVPKKLIEAQVSSKVQNVAHGHLTVLYPNIEAYPVIELRPTAPASWESKSETVGKGAFCSFQLQIVQL